MYTPFSAHDPMVGDDEDAIWARRQPLGNGGYQQYPGTARFSPKSMPRNIVSPYGPPYQLQNQENAGGFVQQASPAGMMSGPYQQSTVVHTAVKPLPDSDVYRVGIYGWRKRCLYAFVLLLTIVIFVNLAFTIWIMTVLNFNSDGMGALKIENDQIRVMGRAEFEKPVQFSQLTTSGDKVLSIHSGNGVHISSHNASGHSTASMNLRPDGKAYVVCDRFEVLDPQKKLLFFVDSSEIGHKLENLRILDEGGSIFEGAIQTAKIRPEADHPLSLESPTRSLRIEAGQDIELFSGAGEVTVNSLLDIKLNAEQGEIHIDTSSIYISGLEQSSAFGGTIPGSIPNSAFQLCVCPSGKLFLAVERADCRADRSICN